jgi:hypothetical protein
VKREAEEARPRGDWRYIRRCPNGCWLQRCQATLLGGHLSNFKRPRFGAAFILRMERHGRKSSPAEAGLEKSCHDAAGPPLRTK